MGTKKYILTIFLLIFLPLCIVGQIRVTKRQAEQIGTKKYILSNGDTTLVVNPISEGLKDSYSNFLFRKESTPELDSIFMDSQSNYSSLEAATLDVARLLRDIEREQKVNNENNASLSFRLSTHARNLKKKQKEARGIADDILKRDPSVEELASMYLVFGDKPTYYINGVEVSQQLVNQLYPSDVIERATRVTDTASGNPNGEVWLLVTEKALNRIKIPVSLTYNSPFDNTHTTVVGPPVQSDATKELSKFLEEKKKQEIKSTLKPEPVVKRELTDDGQYVDKVVAQPQSIEQEKASEQERTPKTRVISRTINDEKADANKPIVTAPPVNPARTSIPVVRRQSSESENIYEGLPVEIENKQKESKTTPKKSVRRIKERHQQD